MADEQTNRVWNWVNNHIDTFTVGALFAAVVVVVVITVLDNKKVTALDKFAKQHILTVTATDKNCNDCHLGASFVNLFNHPAVKGNDNTVSLMMDKAKIKRW